MLSASRPFSLLPLLGALVSVTLCSAAGAASFVIAPTSLRLEGGARTTATSVRNDTAVPVSFKVELAAWTQDGADRYTLSRDLIVNPTSFTLKPGQQQTIRVGWRGAPGSGEKAYRVYIQELPAASSPNAAAGMQVQALYRAGVPLLTYPKLGQPELKFSLEGTAGERMLVAQNVGTHFVTLQDVNIAVGEAKLVPGSVTVLAGGTLRLPLTGLPGTGAVNLSYQLGTQPQRLTLPEAR
ncbi:fimbrial biogenesis chaperone [Deinococcus hopiensis]|nr:fimbria/pilus periplasmic chaperone [Deinococcus hopiensis]